ncbi:hypothetical protein Pelo_363 [Pelomyxa schiedti]|nr:hypothetical protein Pelo_363 [Pelomyxa schiedti]
MEVVNKITTKSTESATKFKEWIQVKSHLAIFVGAAAGTTCALVLIIGLAAGLSGNSSGPKTDNVVVDPNDWTYKLEESGSVDLWTTPVTRKPTIYDAAPTTEASGISITAAKGEYEPFLVVIGSHSGSAMVSMDPFPELPDTQIIDTFKVTFDGDNAEYLTKVTSSDSISLSGGHCNPIWVDVYVPLDSPPGDHSTTLTLTIDGSDIAIPISLYVYNFELPPAGHYFSMMNMGDPTGSTDTDEEAKTNMFVHRFNPTSVTWPSGFTYYITWDSVANPNQCEEFYDEMDEGEEYSIHYLSRKYLLGEGWNSYGFPITEVLQFVSNSQPRPYTFCGESIGDDFGTSAYNAEWKKYLTALRNYLSDNEMLEKSYYYVQNEPQDQDDYDLAISLCQIAKDAASDLKIAISEQPRPEIAEYCGYDIWIAHTGAYQRDYAWERIHDHGETVWLYSLPQDAQPLFNPTLTETSGMEVRIISWVSWTERMVGYAYYDAGTWWSGSQANYRAKLFRESFDDYEYFYLANGNKYPEPYVTETVDPSVTSVAQSLTSWIKEPSVVMTIRDGIGRYIEGTSDTLPVVDYDTGKRPRGNYYVNFQDPDSQPTADPLVVDGKTYMKIGWMPFTDDEEPYCGWYGENIDNPSIALYGYNDVSGYTETEKSFIYDDYGRQNVFEFLLGNGEYDVTVSVGFPNRAYPNDPCNVWIENIKVIDEEATTDTQYQIVRTQRISLKDGSLTLTVGGRDADGNWVYTFLDYMDVVSLDSSSG